MGYLDQEIRDSGEYRGMERSVYEGGIEIRHGRPSSVGHERYKYPGPPHVRPRQDRLPGPFYHSGGQRPSESGLFLGPAGSGGEPLRMALPSPRLRDRFISGLLNPTIKEYTWDQRPANYMECLAAVQGKQATLQLLSPSSQGSSNRTNGTSNNRQPPADAYSVGSSTFGSGSNSILGVTCHFCKKGGHILRQCPMLDQAHCIIEGAGGINTARGGFRRGFGRSRGRGRRRARGGARGGGSKGAAGGDDGRKKGPQLSALGAPEEADLIEENDDSAQADDEYSESEN